VRRSTLPILWQTALVAAALAVGWFVAVAMPGRSFRGSAPPLSAEQIKLRDELRRDVEELSTRIGERNDVLNDHLEAAAAYIEKSFLLAGLRPERQTFIAEAVSCSNIEAEIRGTAKPDEIIVIGAHYDSVDESPGADDNASGTAALLALARRHSAIKPLRTIRFVAFVNEEPPHFQTGDMGSVVYARRCAERKEKIVGMLSIESVGFYRDEEGSQTYPPLLSVFFPTRGNFVAFAGNLGSLGLLRRSIRTFREVAEIPSEGAALPEVVREIGWSDQWSFWRYGYRGIMVTDTAPFRNPHYHTAHDVPETLDYARFARVVDGLVAVVRGLAKP
jgi:Zn-dependent M28 family amino/carboxypeptidase